jgi:hypothetical protein
MVNSRRQDNQITFLEPDPHPVITLTPNIKVARAIQNVPDFFVLVQMLVEERLYFLFVDVTHLLWADGDLISVPVVAGCGDRVNAGDFGYAVVDDTELF